MVFIGWDISVTPSVHIESDLVRGKDGKWRVVSYKTILPNAALLK